jgi:DNA polymerase-1
MSRLHLLPKPIIVDTVDKAKKALIDIKKQPWVAVDTETTSLSIVEAHLLCWSIAWPGPPGARLFIPFTGSTLSVFPLFKEWLQDPRYKKVFHHAKYDMSVFENHGVEVKGLYYDTYVLDWLVDENREGKHGLKDCALDHLDMRMVEYKDLLKKHGAEDFTGIPTDEKVEYATKDAWATAMLVSSPSLIHSTREEELSLVEILKRTPAAIPGRRDRTLHDHYLEAEVPFIQVLGKMERKGIYIDKGHLLDINPQLTSRMEELGFKFNSLAKRAVNLQSPKDLRTLFYVEKKMKPTKWTSGGKSGKREPSVDQDVIELEAVKETRKGKQGLFSVLGEFRKLAKLRGTYVEGILKRISPDGRIHGSFRLDLVTGRLSCSNPNLQNIPEAKKDKWQIRGAFIPEPSKIAGGNKKLLIVADYEQIEIRIAAHLANDKKLIDAILSGVDIHARTASEMYGLDYDRIMEAKEKEKPDQTAEDKRLLIARGDAKTVIFGLFYGQNAFGLSMQLGCSPEEAQDKINRVFAAYPGVAIWMDKTKSSCRETMMVQTLLGRYRHLRDIRKGLELQDGRWIPDGDRVAGRLRKHAENQCVNSPVQGGAADIVKMAMVKTGGVKGVSDQSLIDLDCSLLLQVHDELIWECPEENVGKAKQIIRKLLEKPLEFDLKVPLTVDIGTGMTWSEAK